MLHKVSVLLSQDLKLIGQSANFHIRLVPSITILLPLCLHSIEVRLENRVGRLERLVLVEDLAMSTLCLSLLTERTVTLAPERNHKLIQTADLVRVVFHTRSHFVHLRLKLGHLLGQS